MSAPVDRSRPDPARLRVGDAEREQAAGSLAEQYALGRLSDREHDERLDAVWSARTRADLDVLFHDLPATPAGAYPAARAGSGREPDRRGSTGPRPWVLAIAACALVLGVVLVVENPVLLVLAGVVLFVALKRHRRRQRRAAGPPLWH